MSVRTLAWLVAFGLEKVMVLAGYDDEGRRRRRR
jgi:hypothetical protein